MVHTEEGSFKLRDGTNLYTKTWKPDTPPTAILIHLHGFSDHCNAYYDLFPSLTKHSIQVHSFDQRGWGRSVHTPPDRGLSGPSKTVLSDIHEFVSHIATLNTNPTLPLFLMGHSMGGAEALHYLLNHNFKPTRPHFSGLLLASPYIDLDKENAPHWFTIKAGKIAAKMMPNKQLKQELDAKYMSRNKTVQDDWKNDQLCHDTGTLGGLAGMLERSADLTSLSHGGFIQNYDVHLPCPLWLGHGDADKVTSFTASQRLYDVLEAPEEDRHFETYAGGYHKLHGEPDGMAEKFGEDVSRWVVSRSGGPLTREETGGSHRHKHHGADGGGAKARM